MSHFVQDHPFGKPFNSSAQGNPQGSSTMGTQGSSRGMNNGGTEDLSRVFNTALIATQVPENPNSANELHELIDSLPFRAILNAVRQLAKAEGISERQAAEMLIRTFRKMDKIWTDYVFQEGIDRLRNQLTPR